MGFDGAKFFEKLEQLGLKYICRLKSNSTLITQSDDSVQLYNELQTRIVKYKIHKKYYYLRLMCSNNYIIKDGQLKKCLNT